MKDNNSFDIAVIGGGPAGMMAAGRAAELGAKVALIEKNERLMDGYFSFYLCTDFTPGDRYSGLW